MTGRSFLHHFGSVTQKAIKAGMENPLASLGDRAYYRQKYSLPGSNATGGGSKISS